jgi:hypothetical protein
MLMNILGLEDFGESLLSERFGMVGYQTLELTGVGS